ncbi:MAG: hypothetical protein HN909_06050 [Phycisphaerales bacterium]|jgi:hypothetical protein|nr:hypothetical protein [Phycisphaerales bacterium]MBT7171315.1 hypothetical protein [Phycisphaerales bacterium]
MERKRYVILTGISAEAGLAAVSEALAQKAWHTGHRRGIGRVRYGGQPRACLCAWSCDGCGYSLDPEAASVCPLVSGQSTSGECSPECGSDDQGFVAEVVARAGSECAARWVDRSEITPA